MTSISDKGSDSKKNKKAGGSPDEGKHDSGVDEIYTPITGKRYFRRREDIKEAEPNSKIWLVSFTDVMALMLTFFVLLYSMSEPEQKNWSAVTAALQSEFNKFYGAALNTGSVDDINLERISFDRALNINYLSSLIDTLRQENEALANITITAQNGRLIVSLPQDLLFEPGRADVKEQGARALYTLGSALLRIRNKIEVVGHADPRPVSGGGEGSFSSNWELSLARAASVAGVMESVGYSRPLTLRGMSSGRYEDLADVRDEQQRLDLSRRVDLVILSHDGRRSRVF